MPRKPSVRDRVVRELRAAVDDSRSRGVKKLPPTRALGRQLGAAVGTVTQAVRQLKRERVLDPRPGAGLRILPLMPPVPEPPNRGQPAFGRKWEAVRATMVHDLVTGRYEAGKALPSRKLLAARYGVCYRTMRKVLAGLAADGLTDAAVRVFRVSTLAQHPAPRRVMLILRATDPGAIAVESARNQEVYRSIETECARAGLRLQPIPYVYRGTALLSPDGERLPYPPGADLSPVAGFIVWGQGLEGLDLPRFILELSSHGKPVAVLDEMGFVDFGPIHTPGHLNRVFALGIDASAGQDMGRFLFGLGQRRVAFISTMRFNQRLPGLMAAYRAVGLEDAVTAFVSETDDDTTLAPRRDVYDPAVMRATLVKAFRGMHFGRAFAERIAETASAEIGSMAVREARRSLLLPLMRRAHRHAEITAWVAANDRTATLCLQFLSHQGVRVPQDLSVVSFDDTPEALHYGLTSYNFDVPSVVRAMFSHLRDPRASALAASRHQPVVIEGFVTERATTGPAPRQ